jgi:uncharacterized protein (DUF2237 family)
MLISETGIIEKTFGHTHGKDVGRHIVCTVSVILELVKAFLHDVKCLRMLM